MTGLGFLVSRAFVEAIITFAMYVVGGWYLIEGLSESGGPAMVTIGSAMVFAAFIYGIVKPLLVFKPKDYVPPRKGDFWWQGMSGGVERYWLLQFLNRLWPGIGLLFSRYWYYGLALVIMGWAMFQLPAALGFAGQRMVEAFFIAATNAVAFIVTLRLRALGGGEKAKTYLATIGLSVVVLLSIRVGDIIRDNYMFTPLTDNVKVKGLSIGDFIVSKRVETESERMTLVTEKALVLYGEMATKSIARIVKFEEGMNPDSIIGDPIQILFPFQKAGFISDIERQMVGEE
ncbi:MAG: hypothetical protein Kapaf2KO_20890 [Candidatus Kapaibacteriales bacterium]